MRNKILKWIHDAFFAMGVVTLLTLILSKFYDNICIHFLEWMVLTTGVGAIIEGVVHEYRLFSQKRVVRSAILGLFVSVFFLLTFDFDHYYPGMSDMNNWRLWISTILSVVLVVATIGAIQDKLYVRSLKKINKKLEDMNDFKEDK
ncbi:MAG: hypothetical protein E7619_02310 [Ruminococcaceae bacterium]|nr:hypothetical protein [Oscillospiraceae bacterium]